jgi:hypothetical protein
MIEPKEIPQEFVSIRQVWLRQIDRCMDAISIEQIQNEKYHSYVGDFTIIKTITALELTLVDFGEARIKTDVEKWEQEFHEKNKDKIKNMKVSTLKKQKLEAIIQILNKYQMLFESQPKGYSNVEMKSV